MKASEAREIYFANHLTDALQEFHDVIKKKAPFGLSGNFYDTAVNYDYATLRKVKEQLEKEGYSVAYSDGEIHSTGIFRISWEA